MEENAAPTEVKLENEQRNDIGGSEERRQSLFPLILPDAAMACPYLTFQIQFKSIQTYLFILDEQNA